MIDRRVHGPGASFEQRFRLARVQRCSAIERMEIIFDADKNAANVAKHGVSLDIAGAMFDGPVI